MRPPWFFVSACPSFFPEIVEAESGAVLFSSGIHQRDTPRPLSYIFEAEHALRVVCPLYDSH